MNNRPIGKRKQVQLLVVLTLLAWATQTLLHQWGYGQEVAPASPTDQTAPAAAPAPDPVGDEKFVPVDAVSSPAGTLELRGEATVSGADVTLKQVCRWSSADAAVFTPIADLTLLHLPDRVSFQPITVDEIRQSLRDSGVNIAMINFTGVTSCNITRSDALVDPHQSLQQWIESQQPSSAKPASPAIPLPNSAPPDPTFHTLHDLLVSDLALRLNIDPEALQLTFSPEDETLISLAEPLFKFDVRPSRARALGNVSWDVTVFAGTSSKKVIVSAVARAWENQIVVVRPLAAHQLLAGTDFVTNRVLVDSLPDHPLLRMDQCVGELAAQDLPPGTVMTALLVDPVPLVRSGELVTVTLTRGTVQLRSIARALEQGARGQTIRVRNENTNDVLDVVVTGPQEASLDAPTTPAEVSQAN